MIEVETMEGRIIAGALRLAAEKPWRDVSLGDIAGAAGVGLMDVRRAFATKGDIVAGFIRRIDEVVLTAIPARAEGQSPRDALFEVMMARFDALNPHKAAVRSIAEATFGDAEVARAMLASQRWMLEAAGIGSQGAQGAMRVAGLVSLYGWVLRTWLDDDDPGMAKTMAALDRRLRSGEQAIGAMDQAFDGARRVRDMLAGLASRPRRRSSEAGSEGESGPGEPPASTATTH
ncbi:MAG: TetR/AcrR family transcriptional regulator [Hyphomicrobiaceae bacterium]|nr:TetR/AcrR family transcriptional regulator [Hyphomicrobiaceae bacterium]